nr:hypothetical protein ANMEGGLA_00278 [Acinetobacter nosocomialis]
MFMHNKSIYYGVLHRSLQIYNCSENDNLCVSN